MIKQRLLFCFLSLFIFTLLSCKSVEHIKVKTPVDATAKPIQNQIKKTYQLNGLGVHASNPFEGARLNDFNTWANIPKSFFFKL